MQLLHPNPSPAGLTGVLPASAPAAAEGLALQIELHFEGLRLHVQVRG